MKKILTYIQRKSGLKTVLIPAMLLLLTLPLQIHSQSVSGYTFTQSTGGTYTNMGGTTILTAANDDNESPLTNIGFTFNYNCVDYTQFSASPNGFITLGSVGTVTGTPLSSTANCIAFAGGDGKTNQAVTYSLTGTAPNRILIIDYPNWYVNYSLTDNTLSAQIWLYETTNEIKIVYGPSAQTTAYTRQVGLTGATAADFNIRTTTTNWSASAAAASNTATMSWSTTVFPTNGLVYSWTPAPVCTGMPVPGNTVASPSSVCAGANFTLSMSGSAAGCGISYQWQSSPDNITWSNITGATQATYTSTQSASSYYRCLVTCANGGASDFSVPLDYQIASPTTCYCNSNATSTADEDIFNVTFSSLNNSSTCATTGGGASILNEYSDYTGLGATTIQQGESVAFSVSVGTCGSNYSNGVGIWIDLNQNGSFADVGEKVYSSAATVSGPHVETGVVVIPLSALIGTTRMRVICTESSVPSNPCGTYSWGETEDYLLNIIAAVPCAGSPTGGTTTAATLTGCTGNTGAITVTGSTVATGLTYEWYSSPNPGGPWTLIPGEFGATYTPTVFGLYYMRTTICTASGLSDNSSSFLYTSSAPLNDNCENATAITPSSGSSCTSSVAGTVACATASPQTNGCSGTADDDVWYSFVAQSNIHFVALNNLSGTTTDMYFVVYGGSCSSLTQLSCSDSETGLVNGLVVGNTYYIRVFTWTSTSGQTSTFNICTYPIMPISNDDCVNAIDVPVNASDSCILSVTGTLIGASASSQSISPCFGTPDDDVWFSFVATETSQLVSINNVSGFEDLYFAVYSGPCTSLTNIACSDGNSATIDGLTIGNTYYIRIYSYGSSGSTATFDVCVATPVPPCNIANPFCSNETYNFPAGVNTGEGQIGPNYGCLGSTPNPAWFFLQVETSGVIELSMHGTNNSDIDFACWGPYDSLCTVMLTSNATTSHHAPGPSPNYPSLNMIDCSYDISSQEWCYIPNAVSGEYYIVLITNFSNQTQNIIFSQTGGDGATNCGIVAPTITNNGALCVGQTLQLSVVNPVAGATYSWTGPNGFTATGANPTIPNVTVANGGEYHVVMTLGQNVSDTVTTIVVINPDLTITATSNPSFICIGQSSVLTASNSVAGTTYVWDDGTTGSPLTINPTTTTTYFVTGTSPAGCTGTATTVLTVNPLPVLEFSGTPLAGCIPLEVTFTNESSGNIVTWDWNFGDGTGSSEMSPTHAFGYSGPRTITLIATTDLGCVDSISKTDYVIASPIPTAAFFNDPLFSTENNPTITFLDQSHGATSWLWDFGDELSGNPTSTDQFTTYTYPAVGEYVVWLHVMNDAGCIDSAYRTVRIKPAFTFYLPSSFSPNSDDRNDMFMPFGVGWNLNTYSMKIFNRWGELLFSTTDVNQGWDGNTPSGSPASEGVYTVKIFVVALDGMDHFYTRSMTLIR